MPTTLVSRVRSTIGETDHPYMTGAWTPNFDEYDATDLTVIGQIPADLDGVYVRNTENPVHAPIGTYHPFDGDGMIHVMSFRDGKEAYRNRFVRTKGFAAENWLSRIENSSEMIQAQTRRASILASQGKLEQGRQLIRQLPEKTPAEARLKVNAEIGLLRDVKQYRLAYEAIAQALVKSPNEPELLYDQAMMAEKLGQLDDMERLLRQVIKLKPDYHHAYNALGYSLAERNLRLPEAKELIKQALTYAPTDPFIRDSLGWVEFRMGNTAEAAAILEAAYKAKPDAEIAAHYGEVLWCMGQRDRAIAIWQEGKLLNPENETLLETLKRLRVKL